MKINVLVVDDSAFMRKLISEMIDSDAALRVAGVARNGAEAVRLVEQLAPDVVTMDIEMPEMNGLDALRVIMRQRPTPVVMLSSLTREGANETFEALKIGAVDFLQKPSGALSLDIGKVRDELIDKIKSASRAKIRRFTEAAPLPPSAGSGEPPAVKSGRAAFGHLFAIGTSTGGPRALETVITRLPPTFSHPVLVVQHMPPKFTASLAQRLDLLSSVRVVEARHDQAVEGGVVYIAPGGMHMTVAEKEGKYRIQLNRDDLRNNHRPSVDVLFESAATMRRLKRHFVLMTGMGSDGAKGMRFAREQGAETTIAESEETAVIYGMPKAAVELGCVDWVLPVERIAAKMIDVAR